MSEFKFACPVCSQHISCDSTKAGSQMECPTCFQKLTVPQAPEGDGKFILTASKVQNRPVPNLGAPNEPISKKQFPVAVIALVVAACALGALGFVFRDKIFKRAQQTETPPAPARSPMPQSAQNIQPPAALTSTNSYWTLNLEGVTIPDSPAVGIVHGKTLVPERMILDGGALTLRTANPGPPDLGVSIYLPATRGEDFAGQTINIKAESGSGPWVNLRWKDEQGQAVTETVKSGYAMRIEFGQLTGNHLPGKIYLCTPDETRSWLMGGFNAEIRKPQ